MPAEFDTGAFVRTPAWHQLGVVLPEYVSIDQMYVESGLNWQVELLPVAAVLGNGQGAVFEDKFASVRTDKAIPLGVVGSRYEPIQNRQSTHSGWSSTRSSMIRRAFFASKAAPKYFDRFSLSAARRP